MEYYLMEGLEKKGPYNLEEIKALQLPPDSLIYDPATGKWTQTAVLLGSYEAQPANDIDSLQAIQPTSVETNDTVATGVSRKKPVSLKRPLAVTLLTFLISCGLLYWLLYTQKEKDLAVFNKKINHVFKGKTAVSDYDSRGVGGTLHDVKRTSMFENSLSSEKNVIKFKNVWLATKPALNQLTGEDDPFYKSQIKRWNAYSDLVQYYESESAGTFVAIHLSRDDDDFYIETSFSGDMAYKVPEARYQPGTDYGYGLVTPGYSIPTYRPTVGKCYEGAAKYLTEENEDKSYRAGAYNELEGFHGIHSKFYHLEPWGNVYHKVYDDIYIEPPMGKLSKTIHEDPITKITSHRDAYVFTNQWMVWYKSFTNHYRMYENTKVVDEYKLIYVAIAAGIALLFGMLTWMLIRKRLD